MSDELNTVFGPDGWPIRCFACGSKVNHRGQCVFCNDGLIAAAYRIAELEDGLRRIRDMVMDTRSPGDGLVLRELDRLIGENK